MFGSNGGMTCSDWPICNTDGEHGSSSPLCNPVETLQVDIPDIEPTVFHNLLRYFVIFCWKAFLSFISCLQHANTSIYIRTSYSYFRFVYTREIRISSVKDTLNILHAANKYMIFDLIHICLDYINSNLNASNALSIYQSLGSCMKRGEMQEARHDSENLRNELLVRCTNVIDMHAEQILRQDEFSNLESDILQELLTRDTLQVSKGKLFCLIFMEHDTRDHTQHLYLIIA